jgi:glycosidase
MEIPAWPWLEELSLREGRPISLAQVPDSEWDRLRDLGFDLVWLMGIWKRSALARRVFRSDPTRFAEYDRALPGWKLADVVGSPYAVYDYRPDPRIGTWRDVDRVRGKLRERGIGLILDLVPNHTAPDHAWVQKHPEYYIEGKERDFRNDASRFTLLDGEGGTPRFLARGRDPYFPSWADTAQLNLFHDGLRQEFAAVIRTLARHADGLRCDMTMLALSDIFARTWEGFAPPPPATEYWQEMLAAAPDLVWLGEAYWGTETRLLQLGFRFMYDKSFLDFLRAGSAAELRRHLAQDFSGQKHMARFLENHDEQRAAAVFPPERIQAAATLAATSPGMRFYCHGQMDGRKIHPPVELAHAAEEPANPALRALYERLLRLSHDDVFHNGNWRLLETTSAGDASHENLIVYEWRSEKTWKLVAANPSGGAAQGRVALGDSADRAAEYLLCDQLNDVDYPRSGNDLATNLYIRLEAGRAHIFEIRPPA